MPISLQSEDDLMLSEQDVQRLWKETISYTEHPDDEVVVRCVDEKEIQGLNKKYRQKNIPTNVLTFSYDNDHDVALCVEVAEEEAEERAVSLRGYIALLLVHAFLHAVGMDHERSEEEADETEQTEVAILEAAGFSPISL